MESEGEMQVPQLQPPEYCGNATVLAELEAERSRPLRYPMHPCNFLREAPRLPEWGPRLSLIHI